MSYLATNRGGSVICAVLHFFVALVVFFFRVAFGLLKQIQVGDVRIVFQCFCFVFVAIPFRLS